MASTHNIVITLRNKEKLTGPACAEDEAKAQVAEVKKKMNTSDLLDFDWVAVRGDDIVSVVINKRPSMPRIA